MMQLRSRFLTSLTAQGESATLEGKPTTGVPMNIQTIVAALETYDEAQTIIEEAAHAYAQAVVDEMERHHDWAALKQYRKWGEYVVPAWAEGWPSRYDTFKHAELHSEKFICTYEDWDGDTFYVRVPIEVLKAHIEDRPVSFGILAAEEAQSYIVELGLRQSSATMKQDDTERAEY